MPPQRRKRLPTDFFDRLLSNQTDDQINDLLNSLVDEQISPSRDSAPPPVATASSRPPASPRGRHREKIEEAIVTRDEELGEDLPPLMPESGDELIPSTSRMQSIPRSAPAAPTAPSPVPEPEPDDSGLVMPPGLHEAPGLDRMATEFPEVPPPPEEESAFPEAPASPASSVEAEWFPETPAAPVEPAAWSPVASASPAPPAADAWQPPAVPAEPPVPVPASSGMSLRQMLRKSRITIRWGRTSREPKRPKLAKAVPPVAVPAARVALLDDYLRDKSRLSWKLSQVQKAALFFLLPAFVAFSLFSWYPMIKGLVLSFFDYSTTGASTFVGAANYARAFQDTLFWKTLLHAGVFCLLAIGLGFWLPIALAILLDEFRWGKGLLKFIFFLPFLMPTVPAAILWKWMMDQGYGLLNSLLALLPVTDPHLGWLTNPNLALLSIVLVYIWKNTGWALLIYSAALAHIDETLYEEAEIDGASIWSKLRHVTLPAMGGVIAVMLIITIINTLQLFTEVYIMTGGGPMNSTEVIATYIYKQAFFYMDIGYASALSMILLVMLLVITTFRLRRLDAEGG